MIEKETENTIEWLLWFNIAVTTVIGLAVISAVAETSIPSIALSMVLVGLAAVSIMYAYEAAEKEGGSEE